MMMILSKFQWAFNCVIYVLYYFILSLTFPLLKSSLKVKYH